jgi:hypothetical protein
MGCLLEIMSQGHSKAVESQSSPDFPLNMAGLKFI